MKNFITSVLTIFICSSSIIAQCPQQLSFTTQAQINAFPVQYPGCDSIISLHISGNDIVDLTPLTGIKDVKNGISIQDNLLLSNLTGLDSVVHSGYYFYIQNNLSLTSLEGLNALTLSDEHIKIQSNPRLKDLGGLENLSSVLTLEINDNDSLQNLDGLESIVEGVWISIYGNPL